MFGQVNIIPVIAKADTIAKSELKQFKDKVRQIATPPPSERERGLNRRGGGVVNSTKYL